jgi:serine/threonine protein kinase
MDPLDALVEILRTYHLLTVQQLAELDDIARVSASRQELLRELHQRGWLTAHQADQLHQGLWSQLLVGPYILLERLGGGGMGQVFRARHYLSERIAALKRIRPDQRASQQMAERFLREVRAASALSHPSIVTVYETDRDGDGFYLAMEFLLGTDLEHHVAQHGLLPVDLACDYVRQACLGLQHAHERGVVHRDIKPSNLIVTPDGQVKVVDFGLALVLSDPALTQSGQVMGTPDYIAPEQATNSHQVDCRADIYSLGCTLYYLLVGRPPFADVPPSNRAHAHQTLAPPPIEQLCPNVPRPLVVALRRMMAKRPEHRFQTAVEVAEALASVANHPAPRRRRVEMSVPGGWFARPENRPNAEWRLVTRTPATVDIRPGEVYRLWVESATTDAQLAGLTPLNGVTSLQSLVLNMCSRLTGDGLEGLPGLTGLRNLYLTGCERLTDDGLAYLRGLTALEYLDLGGCGKLTDEGVAHLSGLTALQRLDLGGCELLTGGGVAHLQRLAALQTLNLSRCELLRNDGLERLRGFPDLRILNLNGCRRVTDTGLTHLHALTALQSLYLLGCSRLTDVGLERLRRALPACEIFVG